MSSLLLAHIISVVFRRALEMLLLFFFLSDITTQFNHLKVHQKNPEWLVYEGQGFSNLSHSIYDRNTDYPPIPYTCSCNSGSQGGWGSSSHAIDNMSRDQRRKETSTHVSSPWKGLRMVEPELITMISQLHCTSRVVQSHETLWKWT